MCVVVGGAEEGAALVLVLARSPRASMDLCMYVSDEEAGAYTHICKHARKLALGKGRGRGDGRMNRVKGGRKEQQPSRKMGWRRASGKT